MRAYKTVVCERLSVCLSVCGIARADGVSKNSRRGGAGVKGRGFLDFFSEAVFMKHLIRASTSYGLWEVRIIT